MNDVRRATAAGVSRAGGVGSSPFGMILVAVTLAMLVGCSDGSSATSGAGSPRSASSTITGNVDDWRAAVCSPGSYRDGSAVGGYSFPSATAQGQCHSGTQQHFTGFIAIGQFNSDFEMRNDLVAMRMTRYAATTDRDPITVFALSGGSASDPAALDPLTQFGFSIHAVTGTLPPTPASSPSLQPQFMPSAAEQPSALPEPPPDSPALPEAQPPLPDADAQGFLTPVGARCNSTNPAVAMARTAQSLVVICQTGVGRFYYRGVGLQNGLAVEIDDPVPNGTGFVAQNNGVQYSVSPDALTITQGSQVLSNEPMLEYWPR